MLKKIPSERGTYKQLIKTPLMKNNKVPTFLPKTTLETAPSHSFLVRFDPTFGKKKSRGSKEKPKAIINVYNKSKESCDESVDPVTEYDYIKFIVDFEEVGRFRLLIKEIRTGVCA